MKKIVNVLAILSLSVLLLSSCALLGFGSSSSSGESGGGSSVSELTYQISSNSVAGLEKTSVFVADLDLFDDMYWLVAYDPKYLTLDNETTDDFSPVEIYHLDADLIDGRLYEIVDASYAERSSGGYDICADEIVFTAKNVDTPVSTVVDVWSILESRISYNSGSSYLAASATGDITMNITPTVATEMADTPTTRLYGLTADETLDINAYGLDTRGVIADAVSCGTLRYSSLNAARHDYRIYLDVAAPYEDVLSVTFDEDDLSENFREYSSSSSSQSFQFYLVPGRGFADSAAYADEEDVVINVRICDDTDGNIYQGIVSYPVETFGNSMCEITGVMASTNAMEGAAALVDTRVSIDASISAFSPEDRFSRVRVYVFDSNGERVYSGNRSISTNNTALEGMISGGWGSDTPFEYNSFTFVPEKTGTYTVMVFGFDSDGYNMCRLNSTIQVI